jgi:hypothetical protein
MSEQPPTPRPGSSEPTQPLPPAVGAPSAGAPGGGPGAPTAPQQAMYAGPPSVTGAGQPPVGPPPHQPGLWQRATATTGRRWGLAIAAAAVVLILFLGLAIGGLLLLGHSGFGHMADRRLGVSGQPGPGFGPDQKQRNRGQGMPMNPGQMPGLRGMGGLGLLGANGSAHGEVTTPGGNGQSQTLVFQAGDVTAVSSSSVTLKSADGFTQTYPVTSDTRVRGGSISSVRAGDHVLVVAHKDGNTAVLVARTGRGGTTSTQ